jgi:hypothetical protein
MMQGLTFHLIIVLCFLTGLRLCRGDDGTTPGTSGAAVVNSVINQIQDSGIFGDDNDFMMRIAQTESRCGEDPGTYRKGYNGGIWQVWSI